MPQPLRGRLQLGHTVLVPFGPRKVTGYVLELCEQPGFDPKKVKPINRLLDPKPAFDSTQLRFFEWIARYYRAGLGEVIATALPAAMKASSRTVFQASDAGVDALAMGAVDGEPAEVLREVISRPRLTQRGYQRRLRELLEPDAVRKALDALARRAVVEREQEESGGPTGTEKVLRLAVAPEALPELLPKAGKRQQEVLDALQAAGGRLALRTLAAERGPYARSAASKLAKKGILRVDLEERRDAVTEGELPDRRDPPALTPAQQAAVEQILGPPRAHLLFGITGAGKTEVYLNAAAAVLDRGQQVLVLVPEIGLTPLLTGRFRARFGDAIAVLHSGLTGAQRLREWRRIRAGEARVAVGARSALFAPFQGLGLIVVDEEHDNSYKQDDGVRYSARDLAVVRGHMAGCPVVLGSATPSLESWHNAREGRYGLIQLLHRPTPRPVPDVELVDMNAEPKGTDGRRPLVAESVRLALRECFDRGEQAIVLHNRRGYATLVECQDCGASYDCPSCGVSLVLHQQQRTLTCHYCGFHRQMGECCTICGGRLDIMGRGTEQVEAVLAEMFPDIAVGRMDADTTAVRGAHFEILERFRKGETQLLVGTQIVAKGHDFPGVSLAVVLGGDHVLMMPDFRAAEGCFSLLTQMAGRAGRGDIAGRVLVQTRQGGHFVFRMLGDFPAFADEEFRQRQLMRYPPFARLALVRVESPHKNAALAAAWELQRRLRAVADGVEIEVLGPAQAALPKLVGRYRYQLLLRGRDPSRFRDWLARADLKPPKARGVRVILDVDPRSLM